MPGEHPLHVAVTRVGADHQVQAVGVEACLVGGCQVSGSGGQSGEDRVVTQEGDGTGHRVGEVHPVHRVVEVVVHVVEDDRRPDPGDDGLRVVVVLAAERDAAERLYSHKTHRGVVPSQVFHDPAGRCAGSHAADNGQRPAGNCCRYEVGDVVVPEIVDVVVVLAHPVVVGTVREDLLHPAYA